MSKAKKTDEIVAEKEVEQTQPVEPTEQVEPVEQDEIALVVKELEEKLALAEAEKEQITKEKEELAKELEHNKSKKQKETPLYKDEDAGDTVWVGYLSPQGLTLGLPSGKKITLNGARLSDILDDKGEKIRQGKFGLTKVSKEDWQEIEKVYGKTKLFKNGRIFQHRKKSSARAEADDRAELKSGFEQANPAKSNVKEVVKED